MKLTSRKVVKAKLALVQRLLSHYNNMEIAELLSQFSEGEYRENIEKHKELLNEILKKLQQFHDQLPLGRIYEGPHYCRDYYTKQIIERKDPLFLREDLVRWKRVIKNHERELIPYAYTDSQLQHLLQPDAGRPIYSDAELNEIIHNYEAAEKSSTSQTTPQTTQG
ncbi:MAG: hypothetical protein HQK53_02475 [Oligoflexia bacterium]|nr:hypothetical protein [Oligoflexia bacterium]